MNREITICRGHVEPFVACTRIVFITLRASEAAAQCIVIGPVCGFVCVCVCLFDDLLPR